MVECVTSMLLRAEAWHPAWGLGYVDELVQIGINDDPTDAGEDDCETFYWAMQDANYNVLGMVFWFFCG